MSKVSLVLDTKVHPENKDGKSRSHLSQKAGSPQSLQDFSQHEFALTVLHEEDAALARKEFNAHVIAGLSAPKKSVSSMYFYDDQGSELYARITELEEYYPTRTEREIFEKYADDIVSSHLTLADDEEPINIIELGAGDGRKTKILLKALLSRGISFEYIPIDISRRAMANLFEAMGQFFKDDTLKVHGIVGDYLDAIEYVTSKYPSRKSALLFIGSSIGNFSRDGATAFLSKIKSKLHSGDVLLLGCDLRKDLETMRRAYSDEQGVTRNFNLNLLTRMNRELGTNFDLKNFEHFAAYNPNVGAMESYLIATKRHTVTMTTADEDNRHDQLTQQDSKPATYQFSFKSFEPIYTECSFKYTPELVQEMLTEAGFNFKSEYLDERSWFVDAIAEVPEFFDD